MIVCMPGGTSQGRSLVDLRVKDKLLSGSTVSREEHALSRGHTPASLVDGTGGLWRQMKLAASLARGLIWMVRLSEPCFKTAEL